MVNAARDCRRCRRVLVGAPGADMQSGAGGDQGAGYVMDGATGAIAKADASARPSDRVRRQPIGRRSSAPAAGRRRRSTIEGKPDLAVGASGLATDDVDAAEPRLGGRRAGLRISGPAYSACPILLSTRPCRTLVPVGQTLTFTLRTRHLRASQVTGRPTVRRIRWSPLGRRGRRVPTRGGGDATCLGPLRDNRPATCWTASQISHWPPGSIRRRRVQTPGPCSSWTGERRSSIRELDSPKPQTGAAFGSSRTDAPCAWDTLGGNGGARPVVWRARHGRPGRAYLVDGDLLARRSPISGRSRTRRLSPAESSARAASGVIPAASPSGASAGRPGGIGRALRSCAYAARSHRPSATRTGSQALRSAPRSRRSATRTVTASTTWRSARRLRPPGSARTRTPLHPDQQGSRRCGSSGGVRVHWRGNHRRRWRRRRR